MRYERTYTNLVSKEDTRRRNDAHWKQKNCWEESHFYSGLQQKNEDQIRDQNNGLEAKISKEEIRITIIIDQQGAFHMLS